jgi:hypothetical protein
MDGADFGRPFFSAGFLLPELGRARLWAGRGFGQSAGFGKGTASAVPISIEGCPASAPEVCYSLVRRRARDARQTPSRLKPLRMTQSAAGLFRLSRSSAIFPATGRCVTIL